jgi:GNAT superfamily N-acetyltransferase
VIHHIRRATDADAAGITALLIACAEQLAQQGMTHWQGVYHQDIVVENIKNKQVYLCEQGEDIVACVAVSSTPESYYADCWPDAPQADYYITQMAVKPSLQGKGIGKALMSFIIETLDQNTLALDAVAHYPALLDFYQQFQFKVVRTGVGLGDKRYLLIRSPR